MISDPLLGTVVDGRYEVVQRVARGGMATVYVAHDKRLDRNVALKLMHAHLADSPDFVARFRREARAAARLSHPGVVAVYDQGSIDGVAYLIMELVEGPTLREILGRGPLTVGQALDLTEQILRPLGAAHRAGLVHRDIKPENVLLPSDGSQAKVADFGLARAVTESTQTTTGNILGTVAYLAPELMTHGTSSPRADVYAVGVVLYELLTGHQPLEADSPVQIAFRAVHEDVPAPSKDVDGLDSSIDELVAAMTQRDPERRLPDADEALSMLRRVRNGLPSEQLLLSRGGAELANTAGTRTVSLPVGSMNSGPNRDLTGATTKANVRKGDTEKLASHATGTSGTKANSGVDNPGNRTAALPGAGTKPTNYQDTEAHEPVNKQTSRAKKRTRRAFLGLGVLALAGGGGGAWYMTMGPGRRVTVPNLVGQDAEAAKKALTAAELVWGSPQHAYSDTVPEGQIISTSPKAGSSIRVGSAVVATLSRGIEHKTVPDVAGQEREAAEEALKKVGFTAGELSEDYSDTVPQGAVISTDPAAGTSIPHTQAVAMVISKGRQPVTVPDVTGKTTEEATAALQEAGLAVSGTTEDFSDTVPAGSVISSDPAAGASGYFKGDSVSLVISKGPEMVQVPSVTGLSESAARSKLESAGLSVSVNKVLGGWFGTARSTDPAAGTSVKKGSTVTLYVV